MGLFFGLADPFHRGVGLNFDRPKLLLGRSDLSFGNEEFLLGVFELTIKNFEGFNERLIFPL
jgi:hypothetical protein